MAVLEKGNDFTTGDQVTAANLDALVDAATFTSGAVDNVTTQLSSGAIVVRDGGITTAKLADSNVTTAKIADSNVTKAKIENISDKTALGNMSGGAAAPAEVPILDEDDMVSDSDTALVTQQSVKAYADGLRADFKYIDLTGGSEPLTLSGNTTHNYTVSGFTGTGIVTGEIREIIVRCSSDGDNGATQRVDYDFAAAGSYAEVFRAILGSDANFDGFVSIVRLPVNPGQTTFDIRTVSSGAGSVSATLLGVMQRI